MKAKATLLLLGLLASSLAWGGDDPLAGLRSAEENERYRAITGLMWGWHKQTPAVQRVAIPELRRLVERPLGDVTRNRAAFALGELVRVHSSTLAFDHLHDLLQRPDPRTYQLAAGEIARVGSRAAPALPTLERRLVARPRRCADVEVAFALQRVGGDQPRAREALLHALREAPRVRVRKWAAGRLGDLYDANEPARAGVAGVVSELRRALSDAAPAARGAALMALRDIGPPAASTRHELAALLPQERYRLVVVMAFGRMGSAAADQLPRVIELFNKAMNGATPREPPRWFLEPMCRIAPDHALVRSAVEEALKAKDSRLRDAGLAGLTRQTHPGAAARILQAYHAEPAEGQRTTLLYAYGQRRPRPRAAQELLVQACVEDESEVVRLTATEALGSSPLASRGAVVKLLARRLSKDPSPLVRGAAARALAALRATERLGDLIRALDDRPALSGVLEALGRFGPAAKRALPIIETLAETPLEGDDISSDLILFEARKAARRIRGR